MNVMKIKLSRVFSTTYGVREEEGGGVNQRKTASGTPDAGCSITKYLKNPRGRRQHGDRASYHTEGHQKKQIVLRRAGEVSVEERWQHTIYGAPRKRHDTPHPHYFFTWDSPTPIIFFTWDSLQKIPPPNNVDGGTEREREHCAGRTSPKRASPMSSRLRSAPWRPKTHHS